MLDDQGLRAILVGVVVTLFFMLWVSYKPPTYLIELGSAPQSPGKAAMISISGK